MARIGMLPLIARLRALCNATPTDFRIDGVDYFTDDHLQQALDNTVRSWQHQRLYPEPTFINGAWQTFEYGILIGAGGNFEQAGPDSGWALRDVAGALVPVASYTVNYEGRRITFATDQAGKAYFLDCRAYNLHLAAALVWEQKAAFAATHTDWQADHHGVHSSQLHFHSMQMARFFRASSGIQSMRWP
jgi:hypothetical protein